MERFDIALVGCGGVSQMHLDGYRRHPERVRVVAACDPDRARAEERQKEYGIPQAFASLERMIADADWEVAVVCTPTPVREGVIQALANAGKHLFVEKPMADRLEEAERMISACQTAGVRLAVDQNFRYHYPFDLARQAIKEGKLGRVFGIHHQDLMFRQDRGWRIQCQRHALSVMGVHWLDGFRWMLGEEAVSMNCRIASSPAIECEGETEAFVQIGFESGVTAQYIESFSSPIGRTETLVFGENGALRLDYSGAALHLPETRQEPAERWTTPCAGSGKPDSTFLCLDELLIALEEDREPTNSGEDNLNTIALLESAYRSAAEGQTVRLEAGRPV